jgi:hypothetical protein
MDPKAAYASALATAFAEDLNNPAIARVVQRGGLTKRQFTAIVNRDVARGLTGAPGVALFPNVRRFARSAVDIARIKHSQMSEGALLHGLEHGLGLDTSLIGGLSSLGGAIAGAVGAIWGSKIQSDAAKSLAKIQLQEAQIVQNSQSLALKSALIQNATANGLKANSDGVPIDPATGVPLTEIGIAAQTQVAGVPTWGIAVGAAAAVVGAAYAFS